MDLDGEQLVLRPSLCPHHAVIYGSRGHSYRELPLRIAELGGMYRCERSGVLGGLSRVRSIQLNDAHIFCAVDQVSGEIRSVLHLIGEAYRALGIREARYRLSLPGPGAKYVGDRQAWHWASGILSEELTSSGLAYESVEGEAAFYGPKIDVQVADDAGRESTLSTIQIDFSQPERFDLNYIGSDGAKHRPVMVHRSIIGSIDRVVAHLIDLHGGAFPPWLAPTQVMFLPISESEVSRATELLRLATDSALRAELVGPEHGSLGSRIRNSRLVPYQAIIGAREVADDRVSLRLRDGRQLDSLANTDAIQRMRALIDARTVDLWDPIDPNELAG